MIFVCCIAVLVNTNGVAAASTGQVLLVFDDGNQAQYDTAFTYMEKYDMNGTAFVNGATIGVAGDNTLTLAELKAMDTAGWTIGNHGYVHQDLTTIPIDQAQSEIEDGINYLLDNGLTKGAYDLAYPGGNYNDAVNTVMEDLGVQTGRTINGDDTQTPSTMYAYQLPAYVVANGDTVATIESMIDQAKTGSTVVLLFHSFVTDPNDQNSADYEYLSSNFDQIVDYIANQGITTTTVDKLYDQIEATKLSSNVVVTSVTGYRNALTNLVATLTDGNGIGISGKTLHFSIDGTYIGDGVTNANGIATLPYTITQSIGTHDLVAKFVIDTKYAASQNTDPNTLLNVVLTPTTIALQNASGLKDTLVNLVATLTDNNGKGVAGKTVQFSIDGASAGSATTDSSGTATLSHMITEAIGPHSIVAQFAADDTYGASQNTNANTLTVGLTPTNMVVAAVNGATNSLVNLIATLTDNNNKALAGKNVQFSIDGASVGSPVTTDANGNATLPYTVTQYQGKHTITANFAADSKYDASTNTNTLTVPDTTPPTASDNLQSGLYNSNKLVTLAMSEPGTIYYTLNGGTPSTTYDYPITVTQTCNLKYQAVDQANNPSPIYSETYTIDKIAPKITSTTPSNKKTKVSRTSSIVIKFSENIYATTNWSKIFVKNVNKNKKISISKKLSKNTLTIKTSKRSSKTKYEVYIPMGSVKDTAQNKITTSKVFTFKTA